MKKIVIKYRTATTSLDLKVSLWIMAIFSVSAIFFPYMWAAVAVAAVTMILVYRSNKRLEDKVLNDMPALIIDGQRLEYGGKTIDLSQMDRAEIDPDPDDAGLIYIYKTGKENVAMCINTTQMLCNQDELLQLISKRIAGQDLE